MPIESGVEAPKQCSSAAGSDPRDGESFAAGCPDEAAMAREYPCGRFV